MASVYSALRGIYARQNGPRIALLILNWPLHSMKDNLKILWSKAGVKICVDGGANSVFDLKDELGADFTPDFVTGDFDSVREDVLEYYKDRGCEIVSTPDQDETDFTKAIFHLLSRDQELSGQFEEVVVLCGFGSRLDHLFANVNTLFKVAEVTNKPVYLLAKDSLSLLLQPGHHIIHVDSGLEGDWCGLIPIGQPCTEITTTGLKWNLTQGRLEFGSLISTSNTWDGSPTVSIKNNSPILWTMGVACT